MSKRHIWIFWSLLLTLSLFGAQAFADVVPPDSGTVADTATTTDTGATADTGSTTDTGASTGGGCSAVSTGPRMGMVLFLLLFGLFAAWRISQPSEQRVRVRVDDNHKRG